MHTMRAGKHIQPKSEGRRGRLPRMGTRGENTAESNCATADELPDVTRAEHASRGHPTMVITPGNRKALGASTPTVWFFLVIFVRAWLWIKRQFHRLNFWGLSSPWGIWITLRIANMLRRLHPVPRGFGMVLPLRTAYLRDALTRVSDLNGAEDMSPRLPAGEVVLAIDWPRRHTEERARLECVLDGHPRADDARIRCLVRQRCTYSLCKYDPMTELNLARLCEDVALDVAHCYLGVGTHGTYQRNHLRKAVRSLATQVFKAPVKNSREEIVARIAADRMRALVEHCAGIAQRTLSSTLPAKQTVLQRMLVLLEDPNRPDWLNNDWVIRNITTLTVFGSVTSARAMTQGLRQLLRYPDRISLARKAAKQYAALKPEAFDPITATSTERKEIEAARRELLLIVFEAMRFHPMLSMLGTRTALRDTVLAAGTKHMTRIKAGTGVLPLLLGAMHDPKTFPKAGKFCPHQASLDDHLHFGAGPHECVGRRMAEIQMEEIAAAFFSHPVCGQSGLTCCKIKYKGPAVLSLYLEPVVS